MRMFTPTPTTRLWTLAVLLTLAVAACRDEDPQDTTSDPPTSAESTTDTPVPTPTDPTTTEPTPTTTEPTPTTTEPTPTTTADPQRVSLSIDPATADPAVGETVQLSATAHFDDDSSEPVTDSADWTSSDDTIATVDATGLVTAIAEGPATISASLDGLTGEADITVGPARLTALAISPETLVIDEGQLAIFTATGTFTDEQERDVTSEVTWTSTDDLIAAPDADDPGTFLGISAGTVTIQAADVDSEASHTAALEVLAVVGPPALYPGTESWTACIANDGDDPFSATNVICDSSTDDEADNCLHAGGLRSIALPGLSSCDDVEITDALGVFRWSCLDRDGIHAVSLGLAEERLLSDLIDWTQDPPEWLDNHVVATSNGQTVETEPDQWWPDPIVPLPENGVISTPDTVYVVTADLTRSVSFATPNAALVVAPGATLSGDGVTTHLVETGSHACGWIEGAFDATGHDNGLRILGNWWHVRGVSISGSRLRAIWVNGRYPTLEYLDVHDNLRDGIALFARHAILRHATIRNNERTALEAGTSQLVGVRIEHIEVIDSGLVEIGTTCCPTGGRIHDFRMEGGAFIADLRQSHFSDIHITGFGGELSSGGLQLGGWGSVFENVSATDGIAPSSMNGISLGHQVVAIRAIAAGADAAGIRLRGGAVLLGGTSVDNDGVGFTGESGITLSHVLALENDSDGIWISQDRAILRNAASALNAARDLTVSFANHTFSGRFLVEDISSCSISSPDAPLFVDCSFIDSSQGSTTYGFMGQGVLGPPHFPLMTTSSIHDLVPMPTGDDVHTHTFGNPSVGECLVRGAELVDGECVLTFLRDAYEVTGDGIGNDNGLCESGETCVWMPNIGAWQGEGELVEAGFIGEGGILENITLLRYETTGYAPDPDE